MLQYQVDAFTDTAFAGNPAAICVLERWLDDALMQRMAAENNLAETAFLVKAANAWHIRWFTPTTEVSLCGHATLAAAWVLVHIGQASAGWLDFDSRGGHLRARVQAQSVTLDFPALPPTPCPSPAALNQGLNLPLDAVLRAPGERRDYLVPVADIALLESLQPDFRVLATLADSGIIVTAAGQNGSDVDFASRFFAPALGIDEDPVTGSAHCVLAPYWAARLGKTHLRARQLSARGGQLDCELRGDRVWISGSAVIVQQTQWLL